MGWFPSFNSKQGSQAVACCKDFQRRLNMGYDPVKAYVTAIGAAAPSLKDLSALDGPFAAALAGREDGKSELTVNLSTIIPGGYNPDSSVRITNALLGFLTRSSASYTVQITQKHELDYASVENAYAALCSADKAEQFDLYEQRGKQVIRTLPDPFVADEQNSSYGSSDDLSLNFDSARLSTGSNASSISSSMRKR